MNFDLLHKFSDECLNECKHFSWVHGSMIHSDWNIYSTMFQNPIFFVVTVVTIGLQIMLIEVGGPFMKTSPLSLEQWGITIGLATFTLPIGILMRFIPVEEDQDPENFFDNSNEITKASLKMKTKKSSLEMGVGV